MAAPHCHAPTPARAGRMAAPHRPGPARAARMALALLGLLLVSGGCENDPLQTDDDHPDVNGFTIVRNGEILVRVTGAASAQGQIQVPVGGTVGAAVVVFNNDDRTVLLDADEYIDVEVADPTVAVFEPSTPRASSGTFRGLRAGTTTFRVRLLHGDPSHTDFFSPAIPLVATP